MKKQWYNIYMESPITIKGSVYNESTNGKTNAHTIKQLL